MERDGDIPSLHNSWEQKSKPNYKELRRLSQALPLEELQALGLDVSILAEEELKSKRRGSSREMISSRAKEGSQRIRSKNDSRNSKIISPDPSRLNVNTKKYRHSINNLGMGNSYFEDNNGDKEIPKNSSR